MGNGKIGEQLQVSKRAEYKVGKTTQQLGVKPTIATQKREREYRARVEQQQRRVEQQQRIAKSLADFESENLTYENYESEYDKLLEGAKQYVTSPTELKATQGYKDYQTALAKKQAYEQDKYDFEVAKKFAYKGLPGYMLANKRQKEYYREWKSHFQNRQSTPTQNIIIGYDDLGQPMSIAPELVNVQQPQQSKDFFDIIKPDVPEVFQSKPDISYPVSSSDLGKPPTRDELFQEGGGYFLTGKEVSNLGIETKTTSGTPTASQKLISFSEELVGGKDYIGKSGASYFEVQESKGLKGTLKSSDAYYTKLKQTPIIQKGIKLYEKTKIEGLECGKDIHCGYVPLTPTITSVPNIKFLGVQQNLRGGKALTSVRFIETSSKKKGFATSFSQSNLIQDSTLTATRTRGFTLKVGVKQSGEFTLKTPNVFSGSQFSRSTTGQTWTIKDKLKGLNVLEKGEVTGEESIGFLRAFRRKKRIDDMYKGGAQSTKGDLFDSTKAISYGKKSKFGVSSGKIFSKKQPSFLDSGSGSVLKTQNIGEKSLADTKQIIEKALTTKSVLKPTTSSTISSTPTIKQKPITKQTTTIKTKTSQFTPLKTKQTTKIKQIELPRTQTKLKTTPKLKTRQFQPSINIQKPAAKFVQGQQPKYIQRQAPKLIQKPIQTSIYGKGITFTNMNIPRGAAPFFFKTNNIPRTRITRRTTRRTPISIYRKPSLVALGYNIRASRIKGRETAFSIRPIITKKKKKKRGLLQL